MNRHILYFGSSSFYINMYSTLSKCICILCIWGVYPAFMLKCHVLHNLTLCKLLEKLNEYSNEYFMPCIMIFKSLFKSRPLNLQFTEVVEHMISYKLQKERLQKPLLLSNNLNFLLLPFSWLCKFCYLPQWFPLGN